MHIDLAQVKNTWGKRLTVEQGISFLKCQSYVVSRMSHDGAFPLSGYLTLHLRDPKLGIS